MSEHTPPPPEGGESDRERLARHARLLSGPLALAVAVLLVLPAFSTLQPGYYGRYRELRVRMDHWRASTHAKMSCVSCHVDPGIRKSVSFGARSIPAFYSQLLAGPKQTNLLTAPARQACRKCHTAYRQVSPDGDLLIPHKAHVEVLGLDCVVCHKDLVHSANTKGFNRPEMETCLEQCHDGVKATDKCVKCHTRKQTPESHSSKDWLEIHGRMSETTDCGRCHNWTPDYCKDCHQKRPSTHAGNWKKDHQVRARRNGKGCLVCHSVAKFCKECH